MADFFVQATISNFVVSGILATIAWGVHRRIRSAGLANLLWAIVLIKMITPPIFSLSIIEVPRLSTVNQTPELLETPNSVFVADADTKDVSASMEIPSNAAVASSPLVFPGLIPRVSVLAIFTWLAVSMILLVVSMIRILQFHCSLKASCRIQEELTSSLSADVAERMRLRTTPDILSTNANVAPLVWWMARRPVIVLSDRTIRQLSDDDLRFVVTHEMAHIKRRDHWFRWLEWLALTILWWNPIMWWARAQLRITEEMACDDLVLETTAETFEVHQYATSLLNVAELLASPAICPPVVASAINSGGSLENRLKMIMTEKICKVSANLRMAVVMVAACVFPLGVVAAQDFEAVERRLGGAVEAGELTLEQASVMLDSLRRTSSPSRELEAKKRHYMQFQREIKAAVKAGKLSEQDAEEKLIAVRQEMFEEHGEQGAERNLEAKKRRYMEIERKIEAAVEAGQLSEEDAEEKLMDLRRKMFENHAERDDERNLEAKKRRYMEFEREIKAAVKAGKLSEQDAEDKLMAVRREMFEEHGEQGDERNLEAKKRRYMEFEREIEAAVEAGKLSEEDAEEKLMDLRRKMFENHADRNEERNIEAKKRHYRSMVDKIEAALEAGKVSEEDAEKKLVALREKMFTSGKATARRDADVDGRKKQQQEKSLERQRQFIELNKKLKSGDLKRKDFEKKLREYSRKTLPSRER